MTRRVDQLPGKLEGVGKPLVTQVHVQFLVTLPRAFRYQDVDAVMENGVARDILKAA